MADIGAIAEQFPFLSLKERTVELPKPEPVHSLSADKHDATVNGSANGLFVTQSTQRRLVPQVMTRILDVLHPIDQISCLPVNELFGEISDSRMFSMVASPRFSGTDSECFLLEWSDAYTNGFITKVWQFLKDSYDVNSSEALRMTDPNDREFRFQLDKASRRYADDLTHELFVQYETFILDLIYDNLPAFTQLRTFLVDLNASFYNRTGRYFSHLTAYKWAHLIRTIALQCAPVLEKFLYIDSEMPLQDALILYGEVNFPHLFSHLKEVRVLYMPQMDVICDGVRQLEFGSGGTESDPWRDLGALPPDQRLPKLGRLVLWRGDLADIMNYMRPVMLKLPKVKRVEIGRGGFPKTTDDPYDAAKYVFPGAEIVEAYTRRETEIDFKTMHMYFGIHRRPEPNEYYQHVTNRIAPLATAVNDAASHAVNTIISEYDNYALSKLQRTRHALLLEMVHKPANISNSANFDTFMLTLLNNAQVAGPFNSRRWICTVQLQGQQDWSSIEQVLRYWRCTAAPTTNGSAENQQTNTYANGPCPCGRDSSNQMRLRLLIKGRFSLDQILAKWSDEARLFEEDEAAKQTAAAQPQDDKNKAAASSSVIAKFHSRYHIDSVTFEQWLREASRSDARFVESRMYQALYAVLRDAGIESRRPVSFRSIVYERLRKIQFDLYNYVGPTVKFKANVPLYEQQLLSMDLVGALGEELAFIREKPEEEEGVNGPQQQQQHSAYEQFFRLVLRNIAVTQQQALENGRRSPGLSDDERMMPQLVLPSLRKIVVNVQE